MPAPIRAAAAADQRRNPEASLLWSHPAGPPPTRADGAGGCPLTQVLELAPGALWYPGAFDPEAQATLLALVRAVLAEAPLFAPAMPRTGKPLSVRMSNCGPLGWVSDTTGYRYQCFHPDTRKPWPPLPEALQQAYARFGASPAPAEACLINYYGPEARMSLHQDRDEEDLTAPVVSISLGDTALFRLGGTRRGGPTRAIRLTSGDVFVLAGESRLAFHGVDRILAGSSRLLGEGGRFNLTLRRVTRP